MHWAIAEELLRAKELEIEAKVARLRPHEGAGAGSRDFQDRIVIRRSAPGEGAAMSTLAQLDGRHWKRGPALVAEVEGCLRAALPLDGSAPFADPFRATAGIVALLELRASQLDGAPAPRRRRFRSRFTSAPTR